MKKFHFVYLTTNLKNGKKYIGSHSTDKMEDGYLGSGDAIKNAIKKYGRKNFKREILENYLSPIESFKAEKMWINEYKTLSPNGYNLLENGGFFASTEEFTEKLKRGWKKRKPMSDETKRKISESIKGKIPWNKGKDTGPRSDETKEKIKDKLSGIKHTKERRENISNGLKGTIPWNKGIKLKDGK